MRSITRGSRQLAPDSASLALCFCMNLRPRMRDEMTGVFEDVDSAGNLILRTRDGAVPITAADVFF